VQRLQKGHKLVAQDPAESRPVDGCKQAVQPRTNARSKSHPVKALEKCIDEVQDGIQSITYCAAQQPPVQVLHSTVQPIVQVGGPPDRGGVDRPPVDGRHALVELLRHQLAHLIPIAGLDGIQDAVKERAFPLEIIVRHDLAGSGTAPAAGAGILLRFAQPFQLIKTGKALACILDLLGGFFRGAAHAGDTGSRIRCGRNRCAGQERNQLRNVTEHGCRRAGQRRQRRGQDLDQRGCSGLRCAAQVSERGAERCRRQQRLPHVIGHVTQTGTDHIEYQCPGRNASQAVQEGL